MKRTVMKDVLRAKLESSQPFKDAHIKSGDKKLEGDGPVIQSTTT